MLKTRIITASFLLSGLLAAVFFAPEKLWLTLILMIAMLGLNEWGALIKAGAARRILSIFLSLLLCFIAWQNRSLPFAGNVPVSLFLLGLASVFWLLVTPFWLLKRTSCDNLAAMSLLGVLLMTATWLGMAGLHQIGPWYLLAVIGAVSIADTSAYFFGKKFGKNKLAPDISPGKTKEGVYGALFTITLYGVTLYLSVYEHWWIIPALWLLVVLSVMGDLFESMLKRKAGVKDSGNLLPGHGGVLDRIDGLLPVLPVIMFFIQLLQLSGLGLE